MSSELAETLEHHLASPEGADRVRKNLAIRRHNQEPKYLA